MEYRREKEGKIGTHHDSYTGAPLDNRHPFLLHIHHTPLCISHCPYIVYTIHSRSPAPLCNEDHLARIHHSQYMRYCLCNLSRIWESKMHQKWNTCLVACRPRSPCNPIRLLLCICHSCECR